MSSKQLEQEKKVKEHQIQYNKFQEQLTDLLSQHASVSSQLQEHIIVDKTLTEIPPDQREGRKCYKMIGGVLVSKTVDEVIKILSDELKELTKTKEALDSQLSKVKEELNAWMTKNKVKIVRQ